MLTYTTIMTDDEQWVLSANIDEKTGKYYGVSLSTPIKTEEEEFIDNPKYIFGEFYDMLTRIFDEQSPIPVQEGSEQMYHYLTNNIEEIADIINVLEKAKMLKWDELDE